MVSLGCGFEPLKFEDAPLRAGGKEVKRGERIERGLVLG
jgi:hypothetical protein